MLMTLWTMLPANLICKNFILIFQSISFPWKQRTRQTLNEKISQLNSAIDNVSSRLRGNSKMPKVPVENDPEVEATIWDLFPFDSLWSLGVKGTWIIDFQSFEDHIYALNQIRMWSWTFCFMDGGCLKTFNT